jgi:hypothetical protein
LVLGKIVEKTKGCGKILGHRNRAGEGKEGMEEEGERHHSSGRYVSKAV